jgi:hypothetical protein
MAEMVQEHVEHDADHAHGHSDTVVLLGRELTITGGVYTVVFGILAVLTIIEVVSAELLGGVIASTPADQTTVVVLQMVPAIKAFILLGLAIVKSALVVWFYMHMREENRIIAVVLLLPLLIAMLSVMFVLAVPPTGYTL